MTMYPQLPFSNQEIPDEKTLDDLLDKTKARLFFKKGSSFFGSLLCDHEYIWDENIPTACCNGEYIKWNPRFFMWLTDEERITVLAHELLHTGFDHFSRIQQRDAETWNQAADYVINNHLQSNGFIFDNKLMSLQPCLDHSFGDKTTEQIYDEIFVQKPPQDQGGDSAPLRDIDPNSPGGLATIKKVVKATQAAKMSNQAGDIPGEITTLIDKFLNPKLPWNVLLQQYMTDMAQDDYSWHRPNRRYDDEYLPSMQSDDRLTSITYYLDVSGSVTDQQLIVFNSEVKYIHEYLTPEKLTLVTFDTQIQDELVFTDDMPFEKIHINGRGGTCLNAVYRHIKATKPSVAVIFTDHYCAPMRDPKIPTIWIIMGNPSADVPYGKVIHTDEDGKLK